MSHTPHQWHEAAEGIWLSQKDKPATVAIVGGMHGDEKAGVLVIERLLESFLPSTDECVALVIGNPEALKLNRRNTPAGSDLNRAFGPGSEAKGYEKERAKVLMGVLGSVRRLLDIHQTHCATPPLAVTKLDPAHLDLVAKLGLEIAVVGVHKIYAYSMLSDWIDRTGGLGLTIESGAADSVSAFQVGYEAAVRMLNQRWKATQGVQVFDVDHLIRAPFTNGRWLKPVGNGTRVTRGEVLVRSEHEQLKSPGDGVLLLPHEGVKQGGVQAVFALDLGRLDPVTLKRSEESQA